MTNPRRDLPALVFVLLFPLVMAWLYLVVLRGPADAPTATPMALVFGLAKVVQFAFPLLYVWRFEPARLRPVAPTLRGLSFGLGFGLAVALAIFGLYFGWLRSSPWFAEAPGKIHHLLEEMHCNGPARFWLLATAYAVGHSLLEEYYWRWFAFGWLRRYVPLSLAIVLSALGFTAHHVVLLSVYFPGRWPIVIALSCGVFIGGAIWAWLYERSGSLYAPWLSHGLIDAALYIVGYTMVAPYWDHPLAV